jgi:ribonuclease III
VEARQASNVSLDKLQSRIGYQFTDAKLLTQALTHSSHGAHNNERLEFLGDAILGLAIAHALYDRFPSASEGELSRLRATMVRRDTLADIAREFSLGDSLIMGRGELKSGGFQRGSILADAIEAIIGAMFIDGGLDVTCERVLNWYETRLAALSLDVSQKDAKTRLQEYLQSRKASLPQYVVLKTEGMSHDQVFTVACESELLDQQAVGEGSSRKIAEQLAATAALDLLGADSREAG